MFNTDNSAAIFDTAANLIFADIDECARNVTCEVKSMLLKYN